MDTSARLRRLLMARDWVDRAACKGMDTNRFFTGDNERGPTRRATINAAQAVCAGCPVRTPCRALGLAVSGGGVWGGQLMPCG